MPQYPAVIELSILSGSAGFGISTGRIGIYSGDVVASAGDVNGDGFLDIAIGALRGSQYDGIGYVVFGSAGGHPDHVNLDNLDGTDGFRMFGSSFYGFGNCLVASAGDVNGDGFGDLVVSSALDEQTYISSYLVFGSGDGFAPSLFLPSVNGTNGVQLTGGVDYEEDGWQDYYDSRSVAGLGDVNGDGLGDFIVGTPEFGPAGSAFVVYGTRSGFSPELNLETLGRTSGFRIAGVIPDGFTGQSVSSAGDVNGDGLADILLSDRTASYVVFGSAIRPAANLNVKNLDGSNGFKLSATAAADQGIPKVSSAGDVNGDGIGDLIIGVSDADPNGVNSGAAYVVFGRATGFNANIDLSTLNGVDGFKISGAAAGDRAGGAVASAGDVNGDGFDDLIVGAQTADPNGNYSGAAYVVFGKVGGFAANVSLATLDGVNGFRLDGVTVGDRAGSAVASLGDLNDDGLDDIIIGATSGSIEGAAGANYVMYGRAPDAAVTRIGTIASQTLTGGDFGDTLSGLGGDDRLYGKGGSDTIDGGDGIDTAVYREKTASVVVTLNGATPVSVFVGGVAEDTLANIENVVGGSGNDALTGDGGVNVLEGGAGDDILNGGAGADVMIGGLGDDTFYVDNLGDVVVETLSGGSDTIFTSVDFALATGVGVQILRANAGGVGLKLSGNEVRNQIFGGVGDDTLQGGAGNDVLTGGGGIDTLDGGADVDTASYAAVTGDIVVTLLGAKRSGVSIDGVVEDRLLNIENIIGGSGNDTLTGDALANALSGGDGADSLRGGGGADLLSGGAGDDTLKGEAGDDTLAGGLGVDTLDGGDGFDTASYADAVSSVIVTLLGSKRAGVSIGGVVEDRVLNIENVIGGSAADQLTGDGLANVLSGGGGNDTLKGGAGLDTLDGGAGIDLADYAGETGAVGVTLNGANDTVLSIDGIAADTLRNVENVTGGTGNDRLTGDDLANALTGSAGDDVLKGDRGNDRLAGGTGNDRLVGGAGLDTFVFDAALVAGNVDRVLDFDSANDTIELSSAIFSALPAGALNAQSFAVGASASTSSHRIVYDSSNGALYYDADGAGGAAGQMFAILVPNTSVSSADFIVV